MPAMTFAEAQDVLAENLTGYQRRAHQMLLAEMVERCIGTTSEEEEKKKGLLQAGTGTGKSLALMIPMIAHAVETGERAIIGTPTKALQDQYTKDVDFLKQHLGIPFKPAILKGKSNYPCHLRVKEITSPTAKQQAVISRMEECSTKEAIADGKIIDRESFPALDNEDWKAFSMSPDECVGRKACPFATQCFAERAKDLALEADIVVVNLALLLLDLKLRLDTKDSVSILGEIGQLAIDEAHNLPDATTKALEDTTGQGTYIKLSRDLAGYLYNEGGKAGVAEEIERAAAGLWGQLTRMYREHVEKTKKHDPMALPHSVILEELGDYFAALDGAIWDARQEVKRNPASDERGKIARLRLMRRADNMMERLQAFTLDEESKTLRWVEEETKIIRGQKESRLYLRSAPLKVGPFLRAAMWEKFPAILSSATLTTGTKKVNNVEVPDFGYLARTLGLGEDEALTHDAGSPFDFQTQALLFVPDKDKPDPAPANRNVWRPWAHTTTMRLVTASGGGALLLYTSRAEMNEAYEALAWQVRKAGLTVLRQGDAPNSELVRQFKADGNAVLFGLRTFMEGVDIPEKDLRCVVIDKLPFTPPNDLLNEARVKTLDREFGAWSGWNMHTVPSMMLILTQAFGRLIRTNRDRGVVAILDPRLTSKGYGKKILAALPPARRTEKIEDALAFLESIR